VAHKKWHGPGNTPFDAMNGLFILLPPASGNSLFGAEREQLAAHVDP